MSKTTEMIGDLAGSYRILEKLADGGMGTVYTAEHQLLGRKAAVKVLRSKYCQDQDMIQRFFNEARATGLIRHPGLIDIFDYGTFANGSAYLVMELLSGETLAERLERERKVPAPLALALTRQIASAVGAAHAQGVVHRDLKPDNVFLLRDENIACGLRVKVLDFGIAKLMVGGPSVKQTDSQAVLGTPPYMSPEQCRGAGFVGYETDVYSLGCILFEMLCGRPPFVGQGSGDIIAAHLTEAVPSLRRIVPGLPAPVSVLVHQMLAKEPSVRPTMEALIAVIDGIAGDPTPTTMDRLALGPAEPDAGSAAATAAPPEEPLPTWLDLMPSPPSSRRTGRATRRPSPLLWGVLLVVAALTGALAARGRLMTSSTPVPPAQTPAAPERTDARPPSAQGVATRSAEMPAGSVPEARASVRLRIASQPPGAEIYQEGRLIGQTPLDGLVAERRAGDLEFVLRRRGYKPGIVHLAGDSDGETLVVLEPAAPPTRRARSQRHSGEDLGLFDR